MGNLTNSYATTPVSEYDATKVATYNALAQILDSAINGRHPISTTGGTTTLTGTPAAPQAQNLFLDVSGTLTSNAIIEIPVAAGTGRNRLYIVKNTTTGAYTLTVRKVGGTGVAVTQGHTAILLYNDTDIVKLYEVNHTTGIIGTALIPATRGARVYHNANQSIANATATVLAFNTERQDDATFHDTATNNSRLTAQRAGWHLLVCNLDFADNGTGYRVANFKTNGSIYHGGLALMPPSGNNCRLSLTTLVYTAIGTYFEIEVYQTSGGALNVMALTEYSPEFEIIEL